ncbi:hypothetical protein M422DRAFT_271652 [Sphaerobolus stellatus SS14]|uniref:Uncharacterized protein n=1 Tax=Sphaerobolus stellatus (strain SS14) TaxID=990650 RepID=A0A0C9UP26_SPHS4|nr:hypothetical protein M422DRAFT_271652 [Sphaerobolus stellatus SS14]
MAGHPGTVLPQQDNTSAAPQPRPGVNPVDQTQQGNPPASEEGSGIPRESDTHQEPVIDGEVARTSQGHLLVLTTVPPPLGGILTEGSKSAPPPLQPGFKADTFEILVLQEFFKSLWEMAIQDVSNDVESHL